MVKYRWVRMGTEKKRFLYQPSGSADEKTFDYASSAGCIAPTLGRLPLRVPPGESLQSDRSDRSDRSDPKSALQERGILACGLAHRLWR